MPTDTRSPRLLALASIETAGLGTRSGGNVAIMIHTTDDRLAQGHRATASEDSHGRDAASPTEMPKRGWKDVLVRTKAEAKEDNVALLSAGVAFYALLALVPGLIALISIYGLVADPADIERNVVDALKGSPAEVQDLISSQLQSITESSAGKTLFAAIAGAAIALWAASSGMKHLISAINLAYDERETRGFIKLRGLALTLTIGAVIFLVIAFGAIALLPSLIAEAGMPAAARWLIAGARWVVLVGGMLLGLSILYRYAPDRENPRWSWASPGAAAATILWISRIACLLHLHGQLRLVQRDLRITRRGDRGDVVAAHHGVRDRSRRRAKRRTRAANQTGHHHRRRETARPTASLCGGHSRTGDRREPQSVTFCSTALRRYRCRRSAVRPVPCGRPRRARCRSGARHCWQGCRRSCACRHGPPRETRALPVRRFLERPTG